MPSKPEVLRERRINDPEYAERVRGYAKAYRERNLEKERERHRLAKQKKRENDREAHNAYMREWNAKNRDRISKIRRDRLKNDLEYAEKVRASDRERYAKTKEIHRSTRLKSIYGISIEKYNEMYELQDGKCAICGDSKPNKGREGLVVDHCHNQGHIRKLLCCKCNTGLGQFRDDIALLEKAIKYLKE